MGNCKYQIDVCEIQIRGGLNSKFQIPKLKSVIKIQNKKTNSNSHFMSS